MLKQGTFINKKYYSILIFAVLCNLANEINIMVDAIIGGNQLGEIALSAVSIVSPLSSIISFINYIIAPGCSILYGIYIGRFDKENAYKASGVNITSAVLMSLALSTLLFIFKMPFLHYYGCSGELLAQASAYYNWYLVRSITTAVAASMYYIIIAEGAAFYGMLGTISSILVNIFLSFVLCKTMGVSGLGLATVISSVVETVSYSLYFLNKKCGIRIKLSLDFGILKKAVSLSGSKSFNYIFVAIVDIIMNKVIIEACGQSYVAAYSVVNLILSFFIIVAGVYESCQGICSSYVGEKNNYGIRNVLSTALKSVFVLGTILAVTIFVCAPLMPKIYGLTSPELVDASVRASRILAIATVPYMLSIFAYGIYPILNKPSLSIVMSFLYNFFCPLLLSIPLAYILGFDGVSIGMSVCAYLVLIVFICFIRKKYGKNGFPWYLEKTGEESFGYDLYVTKEIIPEIRDSVKTEFGKRGYENENLELLIEELYTRIYEKNHGKKVCSECVLLFGENYVRIIVRDNGVIFNFINEINFVESLNSDVLDSLLERMKDKQYLITTSFNRNEFVFEK